MRVVLSRKGMDSAYGGLPSPLVRGEPMVSLPIPSVGPEPDARSYAQLRRLDEPLPRVIAGLAGRRAARFPRTQRPAREGVQHCHLDPDLDPGALLERPSGWRGSLGQAGAAQGHLAGQGVGPGDLFLFFGWFREAARGPDGVLRFVRGAPDVHALFGWLQVAEVLSMGPDDAAPDWLAGHPHLSDRQRRVVNNVVYVGTERLSLDQRCAGWGLLQAHPDRVLTAPRQTRSRWRLPRGVFGGRPISYHPGERAWRGGLFHSARIGQEFVVQADDAVLDWACSVVASTR